MYQKTKFKNGLTLITAPLKGTKAVTVLVLVRVGSRYETKEINGVSHFVEHLVFKGTKKRPTSLDITKELDSVGAEFNAFTAKDHTGFYIKAAAEEIELAFDVLSDMLFNPIFDQKEIDKERGVLIEEINMYEDNPLIYIQGLFENAVFGNSSLGQLIFGPKSVVKNISRNKIISYKNKFYQPKNISVAVAGNFNKKQVINLTNKYFNIPAKKSDTVNFAKFKNLQHQPKINFFFKKTEQIQSCLGFPAYSGFDKRLYPLSLLAVILGGNMSSRLFHTVREKHGLAYYIKCDVITYQDTGAFVVQAGLDKKRIKKAITLILSELKRVKDQGVTDKELLAAKEFLKGKLVLALEDSEAIADWYGKQYLLLNKTETPSEQLKKLFAVKKSQLKKVASELFKKEKINLVLIGPSQDKKELLSLLKF
jgi:predicted Zn-dependent peptidase